MITLAFSGFNSTGQNLKDSADILFREASFLAYRGVYDSSLMLFKRAAEHYSALGQLPKSLLSGIRMTDVLNQKGSFDAAREKIDLLEKSIVSGFPGDRFLTSELYQVKGNYMLLTGRLDSANRLLRLALQLKYEYRGHPDTTFAYVLSRLGNYHYMVGNYDSAYHLYNESLQLSLLKKDSLNYERALYFQSIGIAQTMRGFYHEADSNFHKALNISKIYLSDKDPALAKLYLNLGRFYYSISKNEDAYDYYIKAQKVYAQTYEKSNINLAYIYWNIGTYYISKGDFVASINYLQQSYFIFTQNMKANPRILSLLMDLGVAFEKKGDFDEAIQYYQLSIPSKPTPSMIKSYRNLANAYRASGNLSMAEESYLKSIATATRFHEEAEYDLALCYRYYGEFLLQDMKDKKGLEYYKKSLDLLQKIFRPEHEDISRIYLLYGEYYLSCSQGDLALQYSDQALRSISGGTSTAFPISSPEQYAPEFGLLVAEVLDLRARILYNLYLKKQDVRYLMECLQIIDAAISNLNGLRMSYSTDESKLLLMNRAKETINTGIAAAYLLYKATEDKIYARKVFELSERSKSIILLNTIRGLEALKMSNIPAALTEKEHQIKTDLLSYNSLIYKEKQKKSPDEDKIRLWQSSAFEIKKEYDNLVSSFESDYPLFYKLKYDNSVIPADSASSLLEGDQAIIEFSKTDTAIYISVLTDVKMDCFRIKENNDSLSNAINYFTGLMRRNSMGNFSKDDYLAYADAGYFIFTRLIGPVDSLVKNKRLILIPDEELSYLSFDALLTEKLGDGPPDYRKLPYLIMRQPISYSGSATILFGIQGNQGLDISSKLLAFAPSYSLDKEGSSLRGSEPGIDSLRLLPIIGVEEEVNRILEIFRGRQYNGEDATEFNFKKNAGKYNVLHLAMHTLIDDNNPLFSKMVFTSGGGGEEDGLLNTYELFSMELKGTLGVLSACNTGSGKLERGEGIMSLARGFIYAGIPSLVMTLWEIEDQSSSDIMAIFYRHLKEGNSTDLALQSAKLEYIQSADKIKSHPSYWAGFVNIGKTVTVRHAASIMRLWWIPAFLLMIIATFFINRQVYRRKKSD